MSRNTTTASYEVHIVHNLMCVMDEEGQGYDCHELMSLEDAKRKVEEWAKKYPINATDVFPEIVEYFGRTTEEKLADVMRRLAETLLDERDPGSPITADDLAETLLAIAEEIDSE